MVDTPSEREEPERDRAWVLNTGDTIMGLLRSPGGRWWNVVGTLPIRRQAGSAGAMGTPTSTYGMQP